MFCPRYEHSRRRPKCPILVSGLIKSPAHFELLLASLPTEGAIREFEENPQAALLELCKTPVNTLKDKAGPSTTRKSAIKKLKKSPQTTTEDSSKPVEKPSAVSHQQPATASKQVAKPNFVAPIPQQPKFKMPPSKIAPIPVVFKELTVPETPLKVNSITKVSSGKVLSARRKTATDNTTPANLRRSSRIRTSAIMQSEVTNSRLSLGLNFESIQATPLTKRKRIIGKSSIPETPIAISPSKFSTDSRSKRLEDALTEVSAHMTIEKCDLEKPVCEFLQSLIDRKMRAFDEAVERHQESLLILVNE